MRKYGRRLFLFLGLVLLTSCVSSFERAEFMADEIATKYWGNWPVVIEKASEAIAVDNTCAWPYAQRATAYRETGRYEEALVDYDRSISLQPDLEPAYTDRAILFIRMGRLDEAEMDLRTSLNLDPDEVTALVTMAEVFALQGNIWDACTYLKAAAQRGFDALTTLENNRNFNQMLDTSCHENLLKGYQEDMGKNQKQQPRTP